MLSRKQMAHAWERASAEYLARRVDTTDDVSYGNVAPLESELHVLGDLGGQRVLDLGCGGGHNAVACARAGAVVTGADASAAQLRHARALADAAEVDITWVHADALAADLTGPFDLILAVQLLQYVDDVPGVLAKCRGLLASGGRLVVSLDHPIRTCFLDPEEGELAPYPVRPYDESVVLAWEFGPGLPMQAHHWPLGAWLGALDAAGLTVTRLLELPAPPEICDELWPEDGALAPLRLIPHTVIFVARPGSPTTRPGATP